MKIVSLQGQMTFDEMKSSLERLPKSNRWVQMGDKPPWAEMRYPTDIDLVEDGSKYIDRLMDKVSDI